MAVMAVASLLAGACVSSAPAAKSGLPSVSPGGGTPSPAPTATPAGSNPSPAPASTQPGCSATQPSAVFPPSAPSNRNLALVRLRGSNQTVVRDITDIDHPSTVAVPDFPSFDARFVSATDVSWVWADAFVNLNRGPVASSAWTVVARCVSLFDWSPDGTMVVYLVHDDVGTTVHQLGGGRDRVLDSIPSFPAVGCESQGCADSWDFRLRYSPDGTRISLVQSIVESVFRIWTADGQLLKSIDSKSPMTMSVWSGNSLYLRDANGVEAWRNGTFSPILPGVAWIAPKASPGGGQIAYMVRDGSGLSGVYVLDTASGKSTLLARSRNAAVFLTPRYIWYQGERLCGPGDPCPIGPTMATGKTYIYDLQTGIESDSIISVVLDVWPHPA